MKKKTYLPLYYEWIEKGVIPTNGICSQFKHDRLFQLIDPDRGNMVNYWGVDGDTSGDEFNRFNPEYVWYAFTPFRQTIVLFLAAMNNEL